MTRRAAKVVAAPQGDRCHHCGGRVTKANRFVTQIGDSEQVFCCAACAQVSTAIHAGGWDRFYRYAPESREWEPPAAAANDAVVFDDPEYQLDFCSNVEGGEREAVLLLDGIHCAACVWLIESALGAIDGVSHAHVNFARRSLKIRWQPEAVPLSRLVEALEHLGYRAEPYREDAARRAIERERKQLLMRMSFAGFVAANVMMAALALYAGEFFGIDPQWQTIFKWYSFLFVVVLLIYSAAPLFIGAARTLRARRLGMDVPITLGLLASFLYSAVQIDAPGNQTYFDTIVMFVFLILVGRYLELAARERIRHSTEHVFTLLPRSAHRINADASEQTIPVRAIQLGDRLRVRPGERIPSDGVVVEGASSVNEALLTGEAAPVAKSPGSVVTGGTLNGGGALAIRAERTGAQSALAGLQRMIRDALLEKSRVQAFADRFVPYFVVATLVLGLGCFAAWWWLADMTQATRIAITVLIITCPCALGLAAPMAIAVATAAGTRWGVLFKGGRALETLARVTDVVFDKTGTLTEGQLHVRTAAALVADAPALWARVHAAEKMSEHPLGRALSAFSAMSSVDAPKAVLRDFQNDAGCGIRVRFEGDDEMFIGSVRWAREYGIDIDDETQRGMTQNINRGDTIVAIFDRHRLLGWCALYDAPRTESAAVLRAIHKMNLAVTIMSGDNARAVSAAARELVGADPTLTIYPELYPAEKSDLIRRLQSERKVIAMVGDGVNDAPALARADVGIAVAGAADLSATAADVVLAGSLDRLLRALTMSKITQRVIVQNLSFSLIYNAVTVPFALLGFLSPLFAAIAMPLSSVAVIVNALRIPATLKRKLSPRPRSRINLHWKVRSA